MKCLVSYENNFFNSLTLEGYFEGDGNNAMRPLILMNMKLLL